jgi:hypothetical protein
MIFVRVAGIPSMAVYGFTFGVTFTFVGGFRPVFFLGFFFFFATKALSKFQ